MAAHYNFYTEVVIHIPLECSRIFCKLITYAIIYETDNYLANQVTVCKVTSQ